MLSVRILGNDKPIVIEFGNEKQMINNWLLGRPLKVITHGWLSSDDDESGVFSIKTGADFKEKTIPMIVLHCRSVARR